MQINNLGYPRIGKDRELKKICEAYWKKKATQKEVIEVAKEIKKNNWLLQKEQGVDLIPSNDFSYYDQVLDMSFMLGAIPKRYKVLVQDPSVDKMDVYFAMARGYQEKNHDIIAMEMTKWFDTNYHYIVPELYKNQEFSLFYPKIIEEFQEAKSVGVHTKPVIIGPITYLLLGKEKENHFHRIDLLEKIIPVYFEIFEGLQKAGATHIQIDEPYMVMDIDPDTQEKLIEVYEKIANRFPTLKFIFTTYFEALSKNRKTVFQLPLHAIHIDFLRGDDQIEDILKEIPKDKTLSLGIIDGRNIWKNDFEKSLHIIERFAETLGEERIMLAPSCSLLHTPFDLDLETNTEVLTQELKNWMSFSKQKLMELNALRQIFYHKEGSQHLLEENKKAMESRKNSSLIHKKTVAQKIEAIDETYFFRKSPFSVRIEKQNRNISLPLYPTTTIGSFPQTQDVRKWRINYKKKRITEEEYDKKIKDLIKWTIEWQEACDIDVLVHGEYERNDMVEYFGQQLDGFVFTEKAWVQSYGSRGVKPPIIFGDVERKKDMTVKWSSYAQSITKKAVKGMLTGPITILQWSFVRDDKGRENIANQIALAVREEVLALEKAGIKIINIDEPAFREGLPLKKEKWENYFAWAVKAFKIASCGVKDETQIHTHMCYSEFNNIIKSISELDADVITIETSRSQMELLEIFEDFSYPNAIGPGVYDIHSPRVPSIEEMVTLLEKATELLPKENIWVNPDCGLKTRGLEETKASLKNMVLAAKKLRKN